jgi:hypothetical protein
MTPQQIEAWRTLRDGWLALALDLRAGLDVEPFQQCADASEISYVRSHLAHFLHNLQTARTSAERAHILGEARLFLAERDAAYVRQASLAAPREQPTMLMSAGGLPVEQPHANDLRRLLGEKDLPKLRAAAT